MQTDEQLTTVNILSLFQTNKSERQSFVSDVIERLESGEADPIKVHAQVKKMEEIVKALNSNETYKSYLLDAAEKNGRKFMAFDAEWSIKEAGVTYNYDQCCDTVLNDMNAKFKELSAQIKLREKQRQLTKPGGEKVLTEDGEVIICYPPSRTSTTTVTVTLK